jgi:tetratricopeptide (TPR) repeat protein
MAADVDPERQRRLEALKRLNEASFDLTFPGRQALADGDGPKALELLQRKHALVLEAFGTGSSSTGTSLIDLSQAYHLAGRYREARNALEEALEIYQRVGRVDAQLDRLEISMMETCAMQGHSFEVERIAKARIARLNELGAEREFDRAITQDNLARLYINQRRSNEAIPLLLDSVDIFMRRKGEFDTDTVICLKYLSNAYLNGERWEEAEHYARRALAGARAAHGENSLSAAMAADECSVAIGFSARATRSPEKANEALQLSDWALRVFEAEQGPEGRATLIGKDNNHKLRTMLSQTVPGSSVAAPYPQADSGALVLPSYPFISHSFADKQALAALLNRLPDWCKPIIFEEIKVPPSDYVSDKLISGILGANGLIFIDSPTSNASFWTAFERDFALRNQKPVFSYNAEADKLEKHSQPPMPLDMVALNHLDDEERVDRILRWLSRERSFQLGTRDPDRIASRADAALLLQPAAVRSSVMQDRLQSTLRQGGYVVIFLSRSAVHGSLPLLEAPIYARDAISTTYFVWLDDPKAVTLEGEFQALRDLPQDHHIVIGSLPDGGPNLNRLDDLMVRLYWLMHRNGSAGRAAPEVPFGRADADNRPEGELIEERFRLDFDDHLQAGDQLLSEQRADRALAAYRLIEDGALRILDDLQSGAIQSSEPGNEGWYWRLAKVRAGISDALIAKGDLPGAIEALRGEVEIYQSHCKTSFTVEKAYAFAHSINKLASCYLELGDKAAARSWSDRTENLMPLLDKYTLMIPMPERQQWTERLLSIKAIAFDLKARVGSPVPRQGAEPTRVGFWRRIFGGR